MKSYLQLLSPASLGDLQLNNAIVVAPVTRRRAGKQQVPTEEMSAYYGKRADAGLIITEAVSVIPCDQHSQGVPGIFSGEQFAAWQQIATHVHERGGKIFMQLWHRSRVSSDSDAAYETPEALSETAIKKYIAAYSKAANSALEAGFDGVEIHAGNGYLIDQFLHQNTNSRKDHYAGSPESHSRFLLEIMDAVLKQIPSTHLGVRLSPGTYLGYMGETDIADAATYRYLLACLDERRLAYVHLGITDHCMSFEALGGTATAFLRRYYNGVLIGCGRYSIHQANRALQNKEVDLVAFGRPFIANPDLVDRVRRDLKINDYDETML